MATTTDFGLAQRLRQLTTDLWSAAQISSDGFALLDRRRELEDRLTGICDELELLTEQVANAEVSPAEIKERLRNRENALEAREQALRRVIANAARQWLAEVKRQADTAQRVHDDAAELHAAATEALLTKAEDALDGGRFDPRGFFVYVLWGSELDGPIYVGQSENVLWRVGNHLAEGKPVKTVQVIRCPDKTTMNATEIALIRRYQPILNAYGVSR